MKFKTLFVLAIIFGGIYVEAASTGLTVQPGKITQTLTPGSSVTGNIILSNNGPAEVQLIIKIEDFIPVAGGEGISFVGRSEGITTVRDWITIAQATSSLLAQGETRTIPYEINVPPDADPGSHFGVMFFKASPLAGTEQLSISTQVGVLTFVTVPGNRLEQGKFLEFTGPRFVQRGPVPFKMKFENTGTVHFAPTGQIRVTNLFGREVGRAEIGGVAVLPTGVKEWNVTWPREGWLFGKYLATAEVVTGQDGVISSANLTFYAVPLWYGGGFILTVVVLFFLIRFIKRRVRFSISLDK